MTRRTLGALAAILIVVLLTATASAFPGVYISKTDDKRIVHSTHVIIMKKDDVTVVTVAPDYEGPFSPFAIVMPVPKDVTLDRLRTMRRENMTRIEFLTAPRFHEFYEKDPCEPGPAQQEWERDLSVKTTGFLGGNQKIGGEKKVAREFSIDLNTKYKGSAEGEFTYHLIGGDPADAPKPSDDDEAPKSKLGKVYSDLDAFLTDTGYKMSGDVKKSLLKYQKDGMNLLVAEVDTKMVEIGAKELAQLAGIRFWTKEGFDTVPVTLGLANREEKQDVFVYVLHPEKRFEPKNYEYMYPPTNIEVLYSLKLKNNKERFVKERAGEVYNAIHDLMAKKHPNKFLYEYAWHTKGCGEPCQNERLLPNELLTLGGDVFESLLPAKERRPAPPEETDEEKKAFEEELKAKELKPADAKEAKKQHEADREELAWRKAVIERQNYILSRFHYRYDESNLKKDVQIGPANDQIRGGVDVPKGEKHDIQKDVSPVTKKGQSSKYQVRFLHYFPWEGQVKCEEPERWRWGKRWRHRRVLNKVWVAVDLPHRRRSEIDPSDVVLTPLPEIGLTPKADKEPADAGPSAPAEKTGSCGCRAVGTRSVGFEGFALLGLLGLVWVRRRRARSRGSRSGDTNCDPTRR